MIAHDPVLGQELVGPSGEPVFLVLDDYGSQIGRGYVDTAEEKATQDITIKNMLSGAYCQPVKVIAFNAAEGWCRDVSAQIALAVLKCALKTDDPIPRQTQRFIEWHTDESIPAALAS
jgi:hypothetical protein